MALKKTNFRTSKAAQIPKCGTLTQHPGSNPNKAPAKSFVRVLSNCPIPIKLILAKVPESLIKVCKIIIIMNTPRVWEAQGSLMLMILIW